MREALYKQLHVGNLRNLRREPAAVIKRRCRSFSLHRREKSHYSQASSVQHALQVHAVQLDILCIWRRESALRTARRADRPAMDILRKAPILASSTDQQYTADTVAQAVAWVQAFTHQNSASVLRILAYQ